MIKIVALSDYKNRFGSKHFDKPYRSGMDKSKMVSYFKNFGIELLFLPLHKAWTDFPSDVTHFIYTGSEDEGYLYKSYIEDVVLGLTAMGKIPIPGFTHLRANNNKGFMEFLRCQTGCEQLNTIRTTFFGTVEEMQTNEFCFPVVVKKSAGSSGRGVYKAENHLELLKVAKKASRSRNIFFEIKDWLRSRKHAGYIRESRHRNKFVVQNFIPGLKNDWKIYWFHGEVYLFYRPIFPHRGFIASGGGYDNYSYAEDAYKPDGLFDFIEHTMSFFHVPNASLDIAFDGERFHLLEIQFLYFGTAGIPYSEGYYTKEDGRWNFNPKKHEIEYVYVNSIARFVKDEA